MGDFTELPGVSYKLAVQERSVEHPLAFSFTPVSDIPPVYDEWHAHVTGRWGNGWWEQLEKDDGMPWSWRLWWHGIDVGGWWL